MSRPLKPRALTLCAAAAALSEEQATAVHAIDTATDDSRHSCSRHRWQRKTEVYLHGGAVLRRNEHWCVAGNRAHAATRRAFPGTLRRSVALHSALSDTERLAAWRQCVSGEARIVLGTRSAVFAPIQNLGLIIVDEEHDASFKQHESGFRYSARDLAILRAQRAGAPVVLGSATPSLETLQNVVSGKFTRLSLPRGQPGRRHAPLSSTARACGEDGVATPTVQAMQRHLADDGQVLVYINRRGYSPTLAARPAAGSHPAATAMRG